MFFDKKLENLRVAILATDGYEESELLKPRQALLDEGAEVQVVSLKKGDIKGWKKDNWSGHHIAVDRLITAVSPDDYDALLMPGGVINPDRLRMDENVVAFVREFAAQGKPIAAICHGPQTLIDAKVVQGKTLTSWPSLKNDILNAGGEWVDQEVVVDHGLITSRKPDDIPAFNQKMIEEFQGFSRTPPPDVLLETTIERASYVF